MRLHRLAVEAFGPFAGSEDVDFDALTDSGLFLLCGPTGAGKTSVLDAVCFGLFGQVPGERDKAKRLRSDHAPAGSGPRVQLEVSLRGRRLRITRSPEWMRPKKRGSGETREHARVLVEERVDGAWQQRSNRVDEAADLIGSLLGLTLTQFCQVALLPQGRFETFLRCGAQDRHALLEKLFGTHRFRAVEDWLAERRRDLAARSGEHRERVTGILERAAETSGRGRPADLEPDAVLGWAEALRADAAARLTDASRHHAVADQHAKDARAAVDAARDVTELQRRHRDAQARDAELRALDDSTERVTAQVRRARLGAAVQPLIEIHDAADRRRTEAAETLAATRAALPADDPDSEPHRYDGADDVADVAAVARRRHDDVAVLDALLPVHDRVTALDAELVRIDDGTETVEAERERLATETTGCAAELAEARDAHAEATAAAARVEPLRDRLRRTERVADAAARLAVHRRQRAVLARALAQATDDAQQRRQEWLDLRQARLDGMAAELARGLVESRPCPVCGSSEHPAPVGPGADAVSPEAEHAAEEAWHAAEHRRRHHTEELSRHDREVAALEAAAEGTEAEAAAARLADARDLLARTEADAARRERLADDLASLDNAAEERSRRGRQLAADHAQLTERRRLRGRERDDLRARVDAATGGAETLTDRLRQLREAAARWDELLAALREHTEAAGAYDRSLTRLDRALADAGFAGLDAARRAMMSRTELSNAETLLRRRADQAAAVRAVLEDPGVVEAARQPAADPVPLVAALEEAERVRDEAVAREGEAHRQATRLDRLHADLRAAVSAWQPVRTSLAVADRMAALCAGTSTDNRHRMRLSAYVLAARLEQVVQAANERLLAMSSGRYTLRHTVARGVGDRRGGLGLQVHDGWTGDLRDPATLSGGETFYTSLALALGLADVVAHEAGGAEMDTLFVDEGFGSLDADTLDEVMDVLDQLRSGGRAVGIVSHVGDLRARVPAQVQVHKSRAGSTLSPT